MKAHVKKGEDVYNNSLLLANAFYNMTYFGNARIFSEGGRLSPGPPSDCSMAVKYYQLALNASASNEQKAKCVYMLAKCERNAYYNSSDYKEGVDFLEWNGFKRLRTEFAGTKYYKEVIKECGYFRSYLETK